MIILVQIITALAIASCLYEVHQFLAFAYIFKMLGDIALALLLIQAKKAEAEKQAKQITEFLKGMTKDDDSEDSDND